MAVNANQGPTRWWAQVSQTLRMQLLQLKKVTICPRVDMIIGEMTDTKSDHRFINDIGDLKNIENYRR